MSGRSRGAEGAAVAGLVLSVTSVAPLLGVPLGLAALITSAIGWRRAVEYRRFAVAGAMIAGFVLLMQLTLAGWMMYELSAMSQMGFD